MNKKIIISALLTILLTFTMLTPLTGAKTTSEDGEIIGIFESEISIEKNKEIDEPMGPLESENVKITVGFKLNINPLAKQLLFNRRIGRLILFGPGFILKSFRPLPKANITFSVEGCPDWCNATLDKLNMEIDYDNEFIKQETTLTLSVNENPPALEQANIIVKAKYAGHWTIKTASNNTNISLLSAYESKIEWETETNQTIPPLKNITIPINITNNGNRDTVVIVEVVDPPENWNISLDQEDITIPIDEVDNMRQINLVVIPPRGFNKEIINLKLTSKSTPKEGVGDEYLTGESLTFDITFYNDGSIKDEEGIKIDTTILIIVIVIIILILIAAILLKRRKQ